MSSQDTQSSDDGIQKAEPVRPPIDPFLVQPAAETGTPAADGAPAARAEAPGTDSTVDDQPADPAGAVAAEPPEAEAEATEHVSTRKPNGKRVLAFGAAAALLVGVGAGAGALGATALESSNTTTAQSGGTFGGFSGSSGSSDGSAPSFGNGSAPSFGNGSTPSFGGGFDGSGSDSSGTNGTAATDAQSKGVVTIMTKLGYQSAAAAGTGIILTSSGEILTNNHVIAGATAISVTDESTNRSYTATVVGTDKTADVAVLQLKNASGLTTASLASTPAKIGDAVTAVGNAGGTGTLAAAEGSVTDVKQSITTESEGAADSERLSGLIETDADIVSGDSGGPMLNSAGQVVGIDTAASSGVRDVTGYAIPISTALSIARTIESGTDTADITIGYPAFLGIEVAGDSGSTSGAVVGSVLSGTPAASTGLAEGDTITAVDGDSISSATDLTTRLHAAKPGSTVTITWTTTTGDQHTAKVALVAGPAD